eukprot:1224796-Amphidinium_carterae.1
MREKWGKMKIRIGGLLGRLVVQFLVPTSGCEDQDRDTCCDAMIQCSAAKCPQGDLNKFP